MAFRKKKGDQPEGTENTDETFGLPEIEYQPLNREETSETTATTEATASAYGEQESHREYQREETRQQYDTTNNFGDDDDDGGSVWPKIFGILAILALAGAAYWFFGIYKPNQDEAERLRKEQALRDDSIKSANDTRLAAEQARLDAERRRTDSLANLSSKQGTVETLTERTRRYYVVAASAIDGDLLMDKAKVLSSKGVNCKIIPPFGKTKFYRLAIAEGDTYDATQATADGMKGGEYGDALWVIRY
jgi:hypothetical protein